MRAIRNVKNTKNVKNVTNTAARRLAVTGAVAAAGLLLAACGGSGDGDSMSGMDHGGKTSASASASAGAGSSAGSFNDADVMFAQMMIPHHEQALAMAELADGRAEDAEIKKIVGAIEKAQDPEIRKMKSWLKAWGRPEAMEGGGHAGHSMAGMMSGAEMKELAAAKGRDFDRRFAELMIAHHEGAVSMAKSEQQGGADPEARKVADDVVRTQAAEIAQLKQILARL
ncbi:DUF305 domain-containing protein [Streptomyces sp. SKN60]|uniref:DUF305 domain-containing protein n=1 Tax=Streptomyces sp. SKN60 TaxID=2855506 RepID=UPI00224595DD|nr:DUF305 domain-containing protein [Streptomyces sp. SKN60]MCX2184549.1 DUF305 domain-containing protein [Streptomyces sp. SKN60]